MTPERQKWWDSLPAEEKRHYENIRKRVFAYMIVCFITSVTLAFGFIFALEVINNNSNACTDSGIIEFIVLLIIMIVLLKNLKL